jgi:predicted membrane metal-binding protein
MLTERTGKHDDVKLGSDRSFGLVFAVVFALVGLWPLTNWFHDNPAFVRWWALAVSVAFLAVALRRPHLLRPLNRLWFKLGLAMHAVVSPVIMGLVFFTTVTPIGMIRRAFRRDPLGLHPDPSVPSYWVRREESGLDPERLTQQF